MDEVDGHLGVLRHADDLAEGYVFRDVAVYQVKVMSLVPALPLQLLFHISNHVVVFGVDSHDAAVLRDLLEDGLKVTVGNTPAEGGEDLEAGLAGLYRFANLADVLGADFPANI